MAVAADTIQGRPNWATVRWVSLAVAGAVAAVSVVALTSGESPTAVPAAGRSAPDHIAVPMSSDAAEYWLAPQPDVRGMSPNAAEHWLSGQ